MTIEELKLIVANQKALNLDRAILVITRKNAPTGHRISVKGMGYGEIANVQEKDGLVQTVAWFKIKQIERYIKLYEASQ